MRQDDDELFPLGRPDRHTHSAQAPAGSKDLAAVVSTVLWASVAGRRRRRRRRAWSSGAGAVLTILTILALFALAVTVVHFAAQPS